MLLYVNDYLGGVSMKDYNKVDGGKKFIYTGLTVLGAVAFAYIY